MEAGFDVTFLSDAIGAASLPEYEAAIRINFPLIANAVLTVDDFLAALEPSERIQIKPGDMVRGSDHGKIGMVHEVVQATGETEAYALVPHGVIFKTKTYVPLDAVVKCSGADVFINIPKILLPTMPWGKPPSRSEARSKAGPAAAEVEKLYGSHSPSAQEQRNQV